MPRHLLPLDGSRLSEEAVPHAVALAKALGAEVVLFRVIDSDLPYGEGLSDSVASRLARAEAAAYLAEWKAKVEEAGIPATAEVREGKAAEQVLECVRRRCADLVVLAAHGDGGEDEFAVGSTAQKVISSGAVSFLLVRPAAGEAPRPDGVRYRRVLAPVDVSGRGDWALRTAASIAKAQGGRLVVAHVVPVPEMPGRVPPSPEDLRLRDRVVARNRAEAEAYLEEAAARHAGPGLKVATRIAVSDGVHRTIAGIAAEEGADLVVVSAHGRGCSGDAGPAPYGRVATGLIGLRMAPLLVLQDLPRAASAPDAPEALRLGSEPAARW